MQSTSDVYKYYSELIEQIDFMETDTVLKTDCYNEAVGRPIVPELSKRVNRVDVVEIDCGIILKAMENLRFDNVRIKNKNLLNISGSYDKILDFSTIDHVWDYEKLLSNYAKMLKKDGMILIIAWTKTDRDCHLY